MMPSYITGIIIAGMYISKKLLKIQVIISIVFHIAVASQVIFFFVPIKSDDTWVGWEELSIEVKKLQENYEEKPFLFSMDSYKTSAGLRFYLDQKGIGIFRKLLKSFYVTKTYSDSSDD